MFRAAVGSIVPPMGAGWNVAMACRAVCDPGAWDAAAGSDERTGFIPADDGRDLVLRESTALREVVRRGGAVPVIQHALSVPRFGGGPRSLDRGFDAWLPLAFAARLPIPTL